MKSIQISRFIFLFSFLFGASCFASQQITIQKIDKNFDYKELWGQDTQVLLIGEVHGLPDMLSFIDDLVIKFNSLNIITDYASEFFGIEDQTSVDLYYKNKPIENLYFKRLEIMSFPEKYLDILKTVRDLGINTIPLDYAPIDVKSKAWGMRQTDMEIRNIIWVSRILKNIAQHPNAKILVHCGNSHVKDVEDMLEEKKLNTKGIHLECNYQQFKDRVVHYFKGKQITNEDLDAAGIKDFSEPIIVSNEKTAVIYVPSKSDRCSSYGSNNEFRKEENILNTWRESFP